MNAKKSTQTSAAEKSRLRAAAHHLKPVVMVGQNGCTEPVLAAIDEALEEHELVKVRIRGSDRASRQKMGDDICAHLGAELITRIGSMVVVYRQAAE
jgi:RNA-binding protein